MQELIVLARADGPYYAAIREAVQIENDLQIYFRFKLEEATWLPKEKGKPQPLADKKFRAEIKAKDDRTPVIAVTSVRLWGDNFAFEYRDRSVISVHEWEERFAPPPVKIYLIYQLIYIAAIVAGQLHDAQVERLQHPPKG